MVSITINGQKLQVEEGITVLNAARQAGIEIPTLCNHPDLTPHGGCRLCVVEIKGARNPLTSCTLDVSDGMEVSTETPDLIEARKVILGLILGNYYDAGYTNNAHGVNELLQWAEHYGVDARALMRETPRYGVNTDPNPFIWVDRNKCILCTRCVRACAEVQGRFVWGLEKRGIEDQIQAGSGVPMLDAMCESCGACAAYCPTGALSYKMSIEDEIAQEIIPTTCTYCGVGCGFNLEINRDENRVIRVSSRPDAPVNGMHLCVKGRFGYDFIHHPDRLTHPMVREYLLNGGQRPAGKDRGPWVEVDWDIAMEITASKLASARDEFGGDSVGVLTSAKLTNEENYLINKFARQVIGTNSIDHCARL
jgi:formate dehydrogenase major subunit/formate dehydrogenase alpha subunit